MLYYRGNICGELGRTWKGSVPTRHDFLGCYACLQLLDGFRISRSEGVSRDRTAWIELLQGDCDFQPTRIARDAGRSVMRIDTRHSAGAVRPPMGNEGFATKRILQNG